jgi:hypothetical protein
MWTDDELFSGAGTKSRRNWFQADCPNLSEPLRLLALFGTSRDVRLESGMRARFGFHFSQSRYFAFIARFPRAEMLPSSRPWFNRGIRGCIAKGRS